MKRICWVVLLFFILPQVIKSQNKDSIRDDMFTPNYYLSEENSEFKTEVHNFVRFARQIPFQHPLADSLGNMPPYTIPDFGKFGAGKGPVRVQQHHPALDFRIGNRETKVTIYAAHDGFVNIYRNAPKYRHYVSVTADVKDDAGNRLGKMVTIYGHVDLNLDSLQQVLPAGKYVKRGDVISKNLYAGTRGGPHLHFEIRYYRKSDSGEEEFYGFTRRNGEGKFTEPSAGKWNYGFWNPETGYGYANPKNHLTNY